jgi:hypothetical protein
MHGVKQACNQTEKGARKIKGKGLGTLNVLVEKHGRFGAVGLAPLLKKWCSTSRANWGPHDVRSTRLKLRLPV